MTMTIATTHDEQRYLSLVSARSPSYARARSEIVSGISMTAVSVAGLNRLVEAENDARRVCEFVATDTDDPGVRELTVELASLHAERERMLADLVQLLGGSAPAPEASRPILQFGLSYFVGRSVPDDVRAALHQMYAEIRSEYLRQATELEFSVGVRHALQDLCPLLDVVMGGE